MADPKAGFVQVVWSVKIIYRKSLSRHDGQELNRDNFPFRMRNVDCEYSRMRENLKRHSLQFCNCFLQWVQSKCFSERSLGNFTITSQFFSQSSIVYSHWNRAIIFLRLPRPGLKHGIFYFLSNAVPRIYLRILFAYSALFCGRVILLLKIN